MPKETDAKINRRLERQEELRELINGKKQLKQVLENIEEIEAYSVDVIEGEEIDYKAYQVADYNVKRLAKATELRLKLFNKTLPDLKAVENTLNTEDGSGKLVIEWQQ
jgi:hypothetical protein